MINTLRDHVRKPVTDVLEAFSVCQFTHEVSFLGRQAECHYPSLTFSGSTTSCVSHVNHCPLNFQRPQGRIEHL